MHAALIVFGSESDPDRKQQIFAGTVAQVQNEIAEWLFNLTGEKVSYDELIAFIGAWSPEVSIYWSDSDLISSSD